ncbi:hypothetical protein PHYBOEH_007819 [Phytophthora boehmeriae]|uniref:Uncharacterized protein n=1 Tax=Phytophthora boehmeriae TaxID=109152 RepID=A0A8T1X8M8_9STRA|nr:hypothetical protein PHYBOEH_007819 [Phytophthora boehmeriae]
MEQLSSNNDKFLEISMSANQHLEHVHDQLPSIGETFDQTSCALQSLSDSIATLHQQHENAEQNMSSQFDAAMNDNAEEMAALSESHTNELAGLCQAHTRQLHHAENIFNDKITELEAKYQKMEKMYLRDLEELRQTSSLQIQGLQEAKRTDKEEQEEMMKRTIEKLQNKANEELEDLRSHTEAAYKELQKRSQAEYAELQRLSTKKLSEVRATLSTEITILKRNSVAELAACTGKAEQDLEELRAQHHEMLQKLQAEYSIERAQLLEKASEEVARLHMLSIDESTQMEIRQYREAMALRKALQTTQVEYSNQVQGLHRRYTSQIEALKATSEGEKAIIRKAHAAETQNMRAAAAHELSDKILFYEDRLCAVREAHEAEARRDVEEATQAKDLLVAKYESDLVSLQHERMREKDELILRYETKLDAAKRASTEEYENVVKLHDTQMAQLREANLSKVLSLEMAMRDLNKQMEETTRDKDAELMSRQKRIEILEASELVLRDYQHQFAEQCRELTEQKSMALCELDHEIWRLDRLTVEKDLMLSDTYRDLKAIKDDHDIKANTILELTFVIKSRDDEIEKLRKALLDNVRTMNTKTEILELTTETLSSKAKELEATKNALRLESGRLSKVEESMHQKDGLLENTELKMESMRLSMENMRLEMKRMQMDMKLQMEHAEGEIELKNGEIRRLHGNQSELKQKNDFCQQTIERLEESLTLTQRQGEESQRRIDLLRLEVTQAAEALSHVSDQLAAKERKLVIITREKQAASSEKQRLQIAYNNLALRMQTLREKIELRTMQLEEVRLQYQEILKKALEEKDERLRSEKRLLILELSSSKDTIRHLEGVKVQLDGTTQRLAVMASEKKNLEAEIQVISQTLEKLEKSDRVLHTAKKDIELKNKFIAEKVQEIEDLNELLRRTQQEAHHCLNACRMEIEDSMSKVFSLICSNVDNIRLTDHLKLSLSNLRAEKEQLMLALGQEKREIMVRAENLQEKLAGMRAGGARAANEINDLQHALCEKKKELAYLQENLAEQTAETRRVQSVCDALSSSRVKLLADVGSEHEKENQKHLGTIRLMEQNLESKVEACQKLEKCTEDQRQERCYLLDNLTTKHGNHENQLIAGYQNKIARIEENHHNERSQLRDSHSREISKLREDYECDVTRIEENYRNEILQVEENRRCEVDQLIEAHLKFVVQLSAKHCGEFGLFHGGREWKLKQINATFTAENATNRSVKFENQQLRTHHDLPQSRVFGWHQALLTQAENELVHIVCAHLLEMMTTQVEHNHDITSMKEYATGIEEFYNVPPAAEYAQVLKNLRQEHVSDKAAADQLVHAQSPSGENVKDELAATSVQTMELTEFRLREGHQTKISRLLETACADEEHHVATLAAIHDESESTTNALKCSEEMVTLLKTKIIHLQEQLQNAQQEATDRKADIAVKNATIESIRKELNLKIETSESTGSVDQFIVLLRQQLETYVMEVYHIELNELEGFSLKREIDVLECVKGFTAMRYYRHMPLTMSENTLDLVTCVDDICVRLQEYDRVVSMLEKAPVSSGNDDQKLPPSRHISAIVGDLDRLKLSVHHLFVGPTDDSGGAKDYDASTWEQILGNLTDLFEILAIPADANNSLIRSQQVVHMLKENQNLMLDARLSSLKDEEHRFPSIGDVLVRARDVTKSDNLVSLEDLMVLFDELEGFYKELNTLRSLNNGKNGSDSPLSDITVAHESSLGMTTRDEAMAFIQRCKTALQLSTDKTSLDDIVKAIEQLMKILQHFEVLEPKMDSPRRNVTSDSIGENSKSSTLTVWMPTIENKVTAILAFVEELKLMADFAQSILNDENKSLRDPASNESSRSSLAELQVLTRTSSPESLGELQDDIDFVIDGVVHGYDRSCHNEVPSTNREDLSSQPFLVDSLVDISLVMSDHQRLLSQTAQWVLKSRQESVNSVADLKECLQAELMKVEHLTRENATVLQDKAQLVKDTERIKRNQGVQEEDEFVPRAKLTEMDKAYAEERVFLSSKEALSEILDVGGSEIGAFSRIAVYQQLFDEIMRLRDEKHAAESYAIQEYELLRAHDLLPTSTSACNTTLPSLSTLSSIRLQLFQQLADSLVHQRQQDSKLSQELVRESRYLQENNVVFDANDPHTSRLAVYKTLLAGQNTLIEEKMEREVALESEKAFLVSYGVPRCESNMEIFKHYVLLRQQLVALTTELQEELRFLAENQLCTSEDLSSDVASLMTPFSSSLRFQVYQKLLQAEIRGSETNRFLQESMELQLSKQTEAADSDVASLTRRIERLETELMGSNEFIYVSQREYEHMLLKEEENRQELARAFEVTQEQAEKDHTRELEKTIEVRDNAAMLAAATYAEALERAAKEHEEKLASQLQKQAGQLEFAAFVHDDYESHKRVNDTPNTSTHLSAAQVRAQLLERFAKRDTAAISMIYKAIRLTTDILSTAPTASVGSTGGQFVTADITQAVLSCVKELKALKEYLVQSLEYATQGGDQEASLTFAQAPFAKWTADAVARATADKESAIDLALCSHREFMTFAQTQLQTRQDEVEIALIRLYGKLKAAATHGAFTADQEKLLALELEAMREKEAKENVVCKFRLNEEYYRRLLDDRKEMEIAQAAVVVELRQENKTLRRNLKNLEQQLQQVTVVPSFRPSSCAVLASTPRVSVISPRILKCAAVSTAQIPMRPERPRGGGSVHKDRFVSDLERDTGQRRTDTTTRRLNDWKSREDVFAETPGTQLEQDFRALQAIKSGNHGMQIEPAAPPMMAAPATAPGSSLQNQELWYRGVRSVHFVSFFISVFHVPRQQLFRVEVFNSDTEQQQQTVYVTWAEMLAFLHESSKAARRGIALPVDPDVAANVPQHVRVETMDILFERARVYGEGTGNVLLGFE